MKFNHYLELVPHELIVPYTGKKRRIRVLLPKDYHKTEEYYPVVYMHDGQNAFYSKEAFAGHSWKTIKTIKGRDDLPPMIVVGIDNNGNTRLNEYSPYPFENTRQGVENIHPTGKEYASFVAEVVKPFVESHYRCKKEKKYNAMVGSSLGASITQYIAAEYNYLFGQIGVFSTANWLFQEAFDNYFSQNSKNAEGQVFFLQVGTNEANGEDSSLVKGNIGQLYIDSTLTYYKQLLKKGVDADDIELHVALHGKHSEVVWAKYFVDCLRFFSKYWRD